MLFVKVYHIFPGILVKMLKRLEGSLKIDPVQIVGMCVCVCVFTPEAIND